MKLIRTLFAACVFLVYAPAMMAAETDIVTGTVVETMQSAGYVYMKFEDGQWIAARAFPVAVGDKIQYAGGTEMTGFHSETLDRTFESILFVDRVRPLVTDDGSGVATQIKGHEGMEMPVQKSVTAEAPAAGEVKLLADGKTIAGIFAESANLKDQVVSLNARVIKINTAIMGRNWITLQDGTGTAPDNSLLATSREMVSPGDLVIVKGTVNTDVDLGYGYQYKVLLEDASFSAGLE